MLGIKNAIAGRMVEKRGAILGKIDDFRIRREKEGFPNAGTKSYLPANALLFETRFILGFRVPF